MTAPAMLFPRDVMQPSMTDEHFRAEASAAREQGLDVQLIDHDAVVAGDMGTGLRGLEGRDQPVVYRGWMIRPTRYAEMTEALGAKGITMRTSPDQFAQAHHLPGWFDDLSAVTPASVWTDSSELHGFESALTQIADGAAVIKDYSKSEKNYWHEAMFIPDVRDVAHARSVASKFVELRGDYFDEGFVIRQFESFGPTESRTWWVDGMCVATTAHPDTPNDIADTIDVSGLAPAIASLRLPFVSVDVAVSLETKELRVVEIGDGQVSDRPTSTDPAVFMKAISST